MCITSQLTHLIKFLLQHNVPQLTSLLHLSHHCHKVIIQLLTLTLYL